MIKLPPKNRGQAVYWNQFCLAHPITKPRPIAKQQLYRENLLLTRQHLLACRELPPVQELLLEIDRILELKTLTIKHLDKVSKTIDKIYEDYYG